MSSEQHPVTLARCREASSISRAEIDLLHSNSGPTEFFFVKNVPTASGSLCTKFKVLNSHTIPANADSAAGLGRARCQRAETASQLFRYVVAQPRLWLGRWGAALFARLRPGGKIVRLR